MAAISSPYLTQSGTITRNERTQTVTETVKDLPLAVATRVFGTCWRRVVFLGVTAAIIAPATMVATRRH